MSQEIPAKANRILNFILIAMLLITVRLWQLAVLQHDEKLEQARKPQIRTQIIPAERGTIRDRFNIPLAQNRIQYNASVSYALLRQIPSRGGRRRLHIEKLSQLLADRLGLKAERVEDLIYSRASLLPNVPFVIKEDIAEEDYYHLKVLEREWVGLCAERTARRIYPHGRLAGDLLGYMGAISREQYDAHIAETRQLEAFLQATDEGSYAPLPKGVNSISEARRRLTDLRERAYTLRDRVGKSGIEAQYDEQLRGFSGTRSLQVDLYGNHVSELPGGKKPVAGQRLLLTLSAELQGFAEQLLAQHERLRDGKSYAFDWDQRAYSPLKQPWIKGGAIVALEPNTGEVLAMASYPRMDPNSFVAVDPSRRQEVWHWLEGEFYVGAVWDGRMELTREVYSALQQRFEDEREELTFARYLEFILPPENAARRAIERCSVAEAIAVQEAFDELLEEARPWRPRDVVNAVWNRPEDIAFQQHVRGVPEDVEWRSGGPLHASVGGMPYNYDKLLFIDLCQLFVDARRFSNELRQAVGHQTLADYHRSSRAALRLRGVVREMAQDLFHEEVFKAWRSAEGRDFLKAKRRREAERGSYQRPYLDYFDAEEKRQFKTFWEEHGWDLVVLFLTGKEADGLPTAFASHFGSWARELQAGAHTGEEWYGAYEAASEQIDRELASEYLQSFRSFNELDRPLLGSYRYLRDEEGRQFERHLAAAFYPRYGYGFGRSWAYRQAVAQGSVFKTVTALTALSQRYERLREEGRLLSDSLNPLTLIDDPHRVPGSNGKWNVGFTLGGRPIPQVYKGGKMLRTHRRHVGEIDLLGALETSSNCYFALLAADHIADPEDLNRMAASVGYGARTGIDIPGEFPGRLPSDLSINQTGFYCATAGQHSMVVTPLQTATMMAALSNGGKVLRPHLLRMAVGAQRERSDWLFARRDYPHRHALDRVGIPFGLFTAQSRGEVVSTIQPHQAEIRRLVTVPDAVRDMLLIGLHRAVVGERGGARPSSPRGYQEYPWMIRDYRDLKEEIIGKTGTAECKENVDLDAVMGTNTYNHLWFACIAFEEGEIHHLEAGDVRYGRPELVVVVYLRFGDYGREAPPIAAQIVKKWRELKKQRSPLVSLQRGLSAASIHPRSLLQQ